MKKMKEVLSTPSRSLPPTVSKYARDTEIEEFFDQAIRAKRDKIEAEHKAKYPNGRERFYVSEFGTIFGDNACWRHLWYDFHGHPGEPLGQDSLNNFELGDVWGLRVANIFSGEGVVHKTEFRVNFDPWPVSGRLDILMAPSLKRVVEVKTAALRQQPYLPKEDHVGQLNMYLHKILDDPEYQGWKGSLFYSFKDAAMGQPTRLAFTVEYDPEAALKFLDTTSKAYAAVTGDALPDRPMGFTASKFPCSYCTHADECWNRPDPKEGVK